MYFNPITFAIIRILTRRGNKHVAELLSNCRNATSLSKSFLMKLISDNKDTEYGRKYHFDQIKSVEDFKRLVPLTTYDDYAPYIERMVEKGEKNLITAVGFQDRYLDLMEMVKEELPKHKAGGLVYGAWIGGIPGVWWWQKKSTCGGQLVEQNIHLADGLRWLYGEPLSVYATASRGIVEPGVTAKPEYDTDDHSTAVIRFPNNVTATLVSACYSRDVRPACGLHITLPDMVIDYHLRNNLTFFTANETRDVKRGNDQTYDLDRAFITAVETGDRSLIRSPYADALKSLKLCFAANESMETGKVIYF